MMWSMSRLRDESQIAMSSAPDTPDEVVRLSAWVHGRVQGVGFRWWVRSRALELGLTGFAANKPDGRVHIVARGPRRDCRRLLDHLRGGDTPGSVDTVVEDWSDAGEAFEGFSER
jgi:acylphosphatase